MRILIGILFFFSISTGGYANNESHIRELIKRSDKFYGTDPDSSYALCRKAFSLLDDNSSNELRAEVHLNLGMHQLLKAQLEQAADSFDKAITYLQGSNSSYEAWAYKLKANLLDRLGDVKDALDYQKKALKIYRTKKDSVNYGSTLLNNFGFYRSLGDLDGEKTTIEELQLYENFIDGSTRYYYMQNKGLYHVDIESYEKAEELLLNAHGIAEEHNMLDSRATALMNLGALHVKATNYSTAQKYLEESIALCDEHDLKHEQVENLEVLIELYKATNDMTNAFEAQTRLHELKSIIYDIEKVAHIYSIEKQLELAEYQTSLAERDLKISRKNEELKAKEAQSIKDSYKRQRLIIALVIVIVIGVIVLIGFFRVRKLKKLIEKQNELVNLKNHQIQEALDDLNHSLDYSKRLQNSLLPNVNDFAKGFKDVFIFYLPKQTVSGDFYWKISLGDKTLVAVADCTGHGVPGALVSVVCINALNRAVREFGITEPGKILDQARINITETFELKNELVSDGMDISLCMINHQNKTLQWSGAHNPLWILPPNTSDIEVIKATKQGVGIVKDPVSFETHTRQFTDGTRLFMFSDGYADQFGDANNKRKGGKKFKSSSLRKLLESLSTKSLTQHNQILLQVFDDWKGDLEQIDDVCIVGLDL